MTSNSSEPILSQIIQTEKNNLALLSEILKTSSDNSESTEIEINGEKIKLPSYGFLKNEIDRINKNINLLSGWNGFGEISLKNSNGEIKTIYAVDSNVYPDKINNVQSPSKFNWKSNWFFESFLNPLLSISIDISNLVDDSINSIKIKRLIIEDTDFNNKWFNDNYLGKNNIDYSSLIFEMNENNIRWNVDENIISINPIELEKFGYFSVLNWKDENSIRKFYLNSLNYSDSKGNIINLNVGDILISGKATKWKITNVDSSDNSIQLSKINGWEPISIGSDVLKFWSSSPLNKLIDISVGINEREFIFLKSINKNSSIISNEWSTGFAIYTNNLQNDDTGESLESYYKKYVIDYSQFFLSIAKEKPISSIDGLDPNSPILSNSNFSVVRINEHKYSQKEEEDILNKSSQRNLLNTEISQLDTLIQNKKKDLSSKEYQGNERNKIQKELETLINSKITKSNQYNTLSKELITIGKNSSLLEKNKFRIRGFWGIPESRIDSNNNSQEVIQFLISYRYLRKDGSSIGSKELEFIDSKGEKKKGFFSEWNEIKSDIRKKEYISELGEYRWEIEDPANPEKININQLDIPISANESVEIKIKSISEAGWPINPIHSEWSNSIIVEFPENLNTETSYDSSIQSALDDENRIKFTEELSNRGLDIHLSDSIIKNEKYWSHDSSSIFSGFFGSSGELLSLFDKLNQIDLELTKMKELIAKAKGSLQVWIYDSKGNKIIVNNNTKVDLFAGYYKEEISSLAQKDQKGAIINKIFYIGIKNSAASTLELISQFPGGENELLPNSSTLPTTDPYLKYSYDKVPIGTSGYLENILLNDKNQPLPWQSKQSVAQWIYFRKKDIGLKNDLYLAPQSGQDFWIEPVTPANGSVSFVWSGNNTNPGVLSEFCIHNSHPAIGTLTFNQLQDPWTSGNALYPEFRHSQYFNLSTSNNFGNTQLEYTNVNSLSTRGKYPAKIGFSKNDRYLIGSKTCGSYLYPLINKRKDITVEGIDKLSNYKIEFGDENEIKIPIMFQYRMQDYYGSSTTINEGKIGGYNLSNTYPQNITYRKKIGIDLLPIDQSLFSFDIEITAKYKRDTISEISSDKLNIATLDKDNVLQII